MLILYAITANHMTYEKDYDGRYALLYIATLFFQHQHRNVRRLTEMLCFGLATCANLIMQLSIVENFKTTRTTKIHNNLSIIQTFK